MTGRSDPPAAIKKCLHLRGNRLSAAGDGGVLWSAEGSGKQARVGKTIAFLRCLAIHGTKAVRFTALVCPIFGGGLGDRSLLLGKAPPESAHELTTGRYCRRNSEGR